MKLYFMIGLPTETEDDVREIVRVGRRAREVGFRIKRDRGAAPPTVTVSVSTHVPKPHTPFQWCAMDRARRGAREAIVARERSPRDARSTCVCTTRTGAGSKASSRAAIERSCDVLETAYKNGARFDSWDDQLDIEVWERAFAEHGIEPAKFLGTIPVTARLPWSHIDVGLEEGFLVAEYRKALKSRLSPPCGKAAGMFIASHEPRRRAQRRSQARLLRLRRRVRPVRDARGARRVPREAPRGQTARRHEDGSSAEAIAPARRRRASCKATRVVIDSRSPSSGRARTSRTST